MARLRFLSAAQIRSAIAWPEAVRSMRSAFGQISAGAAVMPQRTVVTTPLGKTLVMPSYLRESQDLVTKVVSVYPDNKSRGLPLILGLVLVLDADSGEPLCVLDAAALTAMRTAAGSALATDLLARPEADTLALFGAGPQARAHLEAIASVRRLKEVRVFTPSRATAQTLVDSFPPEGFASSIILRMAADPDEAVRGAGLIVTATSSREPVFDGSLVEPGAHVNAVGAWRGDTRELDERLMARAKIVVDYRPAAWEEAGELIIAREHGVISEQSIWAELGEIVNGTRPGRQRPAEITLFKSVGLAAQDAAIAGVVLKAAQQKGLGTLVEL